MDVDHLPLILVTGATGYVGGRLLPALAAAGCRLRCLVRRPEFLAARLPAGVAIVKGDCLEPDSLPAAMEGVHTAYYLIHSMGSGGNFEEQERRSALNFGAAARAAGVKRIIYLGALGDPDSNLSEHLRSRRATGEILRSSGVPVLEFRASIIIGSGSLSYELIRALVERLPIMICPKWVRVVAQPIAIEDVIAYLVEARNLPEAGSTIFEIGGADRVSYGDLMREYARQRGLRRVMIAVPFLTPRLSSLWLGLVTPLYARIGRKLIEGVRYGTVVNDDSASRVFAVRPMGLSQAIRRSLDNEDREFAATRWSDALSSVGEPATWGGVRFGTRLVDSRVAHIKASRADAFTPIRMIGGERGWYYGNWMWWLRGFMDLLVGGAGVRRGRRHPEDVVVGDTIDFWRVEAYEPDHLLRLQAEMKLPGRAWLEFEVEDEQGGSSIRQTAVFDAVGLSGLLYWYLLYPAHILVFSGMLRSIARQGVAHG